MPCVLHAMVLYAPQPANVRSVVRISPLLAAAFESTVSYNQIPPSLLQLSQDHVAFTTFEVAWMPAGG